MTTSTDYAVVRVNTDTYRLDRTTQPGNGAAAFIHRNYDRLGNHTGWKLKPLVMMHGAKGRVWIAVDEALAATKLFKPGEAKRAVANADTEYALRTGSAP